VPVPVVPLLVVVPPVDEAPAVESPVIAQSQVTPAPVIAVPLPGPVVLVAASSPTVTPAVPAAASGDSSVPARNTAVGVPAEPQLTGTSLARTGSDTRSMVLLALMALVLGGLLVLLSGRAGREVAPGVTVTPRR
jgi:hypothetical protein